MTPFRSERDTNWEGAFRVPAMVRWPGHIKPGSVSSEIVSGLDWFPTLVAAAGDPGVEDRLLNGWAVGARSYKLHLDGYNQLAYLTGQQDKSACKGFIYFDDDGHLVAIRFNNWKLVFAEQKTPGTLDGRPHTPRQKERTRTMSPIRPTRREALVLATAAAGVLPLRARGGTTVLPSWNDGPARQAILGFVDRATTQGGSGFIPREERIAVFDNDGTLWCEQPTYVQAAFTDRLRALAPQHPQWRTQQPFAAALAGDLKAVAAGGVQAIERLVMATHAGMTTDQFAQIVSTWIAAAKHPRFHRLYTELVYQPMLELLAFLRARGFRTYIVSGGGVEFIRPWAERVYGVPPEQVIGSTIRTTFHLRDGKPVLVRDPAIDAVNDGPGKPVGINRFIGRRPVFAAGNSNGDLQMLQWITQGSRPGFGLLVHHTDAVREYAYDRQSHVGRLDKALDRAGPAGWTVVDMKRDWRTVFPA